MEWKIEAVLDLTESEHEIVGTAIKQLCDRLGVACTYERLVPHVPMKRVCLIETDDFEVYCALDGLVMAQYQ